MSVRERRSRQRPSFFILRAQQASDGAPEPSGQCIEGLKGPMGGPKLLDKGSAWVPESPLS
jgi:hypothetical protein